MSETNRDMYLQDQEALEERRRYMREYRRKNRDRVKRWNHDYWKRRAHKAAERQKGHDSDE